MTRPCVLIKANHGRRRGRVGNPPLQNQKAHEVTRDVTAWAWAAGLPFGRPLSGGVFRRAPILVSDRFFGNLLPGLGPPRSTQQRRRV
jgi:hypothetical protein